MDDLGRVCDMDTVKVLAASSTPFLIWGTNVELALKIAGAAAAVVYILTKWILLIRAAARNRSTDPSELIDPDL